MPGSNGDGGRVPLLPELEARREHVERLTSQDAEERADAEAAWSAPYGPDEVASVHTRDAVIEGPNGRIPVRIYESTPRPRADAPRRGFLWCHGGGFMAGDLDMPEGDGVARGLAERLGAVVVSVDYRLAPALGADLDAYRRDRAERWGDPASAEPVRAPLPGLDVAAALEWMRRTAPDLGIDPARIAVGGASAGGCLAGALALQCAEAGRPVQAAVLMYPVLHPVIPAPAPDEVAALASVPVALSFSPESVRRMNENYLGGPIGTATSREFAGLTDPAALVALGPAYIEVDEVDDLRPSGRAFAEQLRDAGVPVRFAVRHGAPHGHLNYRGLDAARASLDAVAVFLQDL